MDAMKSALCGAAFLAGMGAELFGCTEKVLEVGHYTADGLRKTADGIDWVTDKAQAGCRAGETRCRNRQVALKTRAAEHTDDEEASMAEFLRTLHMMDDEDKHASAVEETLKQTKAEDKAEEAKEEEYTYVTPTEEPNEATDVKPGWKEILKKAKEKKNTGDDAILI